LNNEIVVDSPTTGSTDTSTSDTSLSFDVLDDYYLDKDFNTNNTLQEYSVNYNPVESVYNSSQTIALIRPITDYSNQFNELEGMKMSELMYAMNRLQVPTMAIDQSVAQTCSEAFHALIDTNDKYIGNIVQMCKCLTPFNILCENDRLVLIKRSSIEIEILRMLLCYNFEDNYWTINSVS